MRRTAMLLTALMTLGTACAAGNKEAVSKKTSHASIGIDISDILKGQSITIFFSHSIAKNWCIRGQCSTGFDKLPEIRKSIEEKTHDGSFLSRTEESGHDETAGTGIALQYWPSASYKGVFLELGCRCRLYSEYIFTWGIGYNMSITDKLAIQMSLESGISPSYRHIEANGYKIKSGICYIF
jgi:hypothetical protein